MSPSDQYQMKSSAQRKVKALPGNLLCCDCGAQSPDWACLRFGVLFCLQCSGQHRSLGTHVSFVRSIDMDSWTSEQIKIMKCGGNQSCNDYLQKYTGMDPLQIPIKEKYDNPIAQHYTTILKCRVEGKPEPDHTFTEASLKVGITSQTSFAETTASSITDDDGGLSDDSTEKRGTANKYNQQQQAHKSASISCNSNHSASSWSDSFRNLIPQRLLMTSLTNRGSSRRSFGGSTKNFESL